MAAPGAGPGPGAPPGLEAALQKLALRRKKVLSAEEMELYELAQAAGGAIDPDVFKILVDLLKLNVAPLAVYQMLKSMCAGQRLASEPQDPVAVSLPTSSVPETREASFLSAKSRSPPARPSFSSAPRPAASPVLLHGPAATHSPLSSGPPGSLRFSCCLFSPFAGPLLEGLPHTAEDFSWMCLLQAVLSLRAERGSLAEREKQRQHGSGWRPGTGRAW
ncbi:mitotic-spindle organizing protein 2B isoform X1 [Suricata suricatta]|uniref:Mitotic spindle organizing protein 2B n=1 Tax=Suricata suricatta TaxID=37032 RepID=A0A673UV57_SURSU|nr:mitotic-spindle organizing protein 2B isoform X1 [Suricata suricatta]